MRSIVKIIDLYVYSQTEHLIVVLMTNRKKGRQDDWITINDNGVESVTHMYTEALLVLVHNVANFPLESLRTIDVFIFVLDDQ